MTDFKLTTPVAFIVFNRPDTTERVFAEIAKTKPPKLLVVGDGPRASRQGEAEKVAATRAIIQRVDWDCEVLTNFAETNLGCKKRVSSGIDWVFEQVEEAIILEDDCLPDPTFFRFCQEMLERYRNDQRIGMISGDNFQFGQKRGSASYYFSRYNHIWGWASWRRAWKHYDVDIPFWPELKRLRTLWPQMMDENEYKYWENAFDAVYAGRIDTWDYQWTLSVWRQGMLTVLPTVNLIENIGFGESATHTKGPSIYANMKTCALQFPLVQPNEYIPNRYADEYTAKRIFSNSLGRKLANRFKLQLQWNRK
jgi:hypothetical protein